MALGFALVHAQNNSDKEIVVLRHARIGYLEETDYTTAYQVEAPNAADLCFLY